MLKDVLFCNNTFRFLKALIVPLLLLQELQPMLIDTVDEYYRQQMAQQPQHQYAVSSKTYPNKFREKFMDLNFQVDHTHSILVW